MDIRQLNTTATPAAPPKGTAWNDIDTINKLFVVEDTKRKIAGAFTSIAKEQHTSKTKANIFKLILSTEVPKISEYVQHHTNLSDTAVDNALSYILLQGIAENLRGNSSFKAANAINLITSDEVKNIQDKDGLIRLFNVTKPSGRSASIS
jgi:hypothetical protein